MLKRLLLIGLLCIGLLALVVPQAPAKICAAYWRGKCVLWTGSLICGIGLTGAGQCDDVTLTCSADNTDGWAVVCGNPGTNTWCAPGINICYYAGQVDGSYTVNPDDCDKNGNAYINVYAEPDATLLGNLGPCCPNPNWEAVDAVPCNLTLTDRQLDDNNCVVSEAVFECTLPYCETLEYDCDAGTFEQRQYQCEDPVITNYNKPLCPDVETYCGDRFDNDGDTLVDCDDPDCAGVPKCSK